MQLFRKILALTAASALLTCGTGDSLRPLLTPFVSPAPIRKLISALSALPPQEEPFEILSYHADDQQLYCDGTAVGQAYGGISVQDGRLTVSAESLGLSGSAALSPAEAASCAGLEYTETPDGITLRAPFRSSRLVVQCQGNLPRNGNADTVAEFRDLHILQYDSPSEAYAAYLRFQDDSSVQRVQPDCIYHTDVQTGAAGMSQYQKDPAVSIIGADSYCEWLRTQKEALPEIKVAVLDTGIYAEHNWFRDRIAPGGITLMTNDSDTYNDAFGHGTHCAGIIAQTTPENVSILPIKVLSDRGYGFGTELYCGMLYAMEQNADVVSMSLGGNGEDWLLDEAIRILSAADIPCIAAAGNENDNAKYHHPARNPECVTISAVTASEDEPGHYSFSRASFSNYGECVDFCAPGFAIRSAYTDHPDALGPMSGTSMATPFVAAVYANLLSYDPKLTGEQLYDYIKANVIDPGKPGFDPDFGWGLVSLKDFRFADAVCHAPVISAAQSSTDDTITVTLSASDADAEIFYTLDGSDPAENGIRYTEPIVLTQSADLHAAACRNGVFSHCAAERYQIGETDLPAPYAVTDGILTKYRGLLKTLDLSADFSDGSLTAIGSDAFADSDVQTLILPESVTEISDHAFYRSALQTLQARGVTVIGPYAFSEARALTAAEFGTLEALGTGAFSTCTALKTLSFNSSRLTEIPAYAFEACMALTELPVVWKQLEAIGTDAFANAGLCGDLTLTQLKTLGAGAFSGTSLSGLTLPESIIELPESLLLRTAQLQKLTAPGIRKIGSRALSNCGSSSFVCEIDFSAVTELAPEALCFFRCQTPLVFSSVETLCRSALDSASCSELRFPAVRHAAAGTATGCNAAVYLPNLESAESNAFISCSGAIVTGSKLTEISPDAFRGCKVLAAPADSPLADYAKQNNIPFYPAPAVYPSDCQHTVSVRQFLDTALRVSTVDAAGMTLRWYRVSGENETLISGETGSEYHPSTDMAGSFCLRAALYDGSKRVSAADFMLNVTGGNIINIEEGQNAVLLDWASLREKGEDAPAFYTVCLSPRETAEYYISLSGYSETADRPMIYEDGKIYSQTPVTAQIRTLSPIMLRGGRQYQIIIPPGDDPDAPDFSVLHLRQNNENCINLDRYILGEPVIPEAERIFDPAAGKPVIRTISVTAKNEENPDKTVSLEAGKDFLFYAAPAQDGSILLSLCPTGDYYSFAPFPFRLTGLPLCGTAKTGSTIIRTVSGCSCAVLAFTPDTDGVYSFYTDITPERKQAETATGKYRRSFWQCPAVRVIGSSGLIAEGSPDQPVSAALHAGETVFLTLNGKPENEKYLLCIAEGAAPTLLSAETVRMETDAAHLLPAGTPQTPACSLSDGGTPLVSGTDYTLTYLGNQAPGLMAVLAEGAGAYGGFRITEHILTVDAAENSPVTIPDTSPEFTCLFTPEESGSYTFDADFAVLPDEDADGEVTCSVAEVSGSLTAQGFRQKSLSVSAELTAGKTYACMLKKTIPGDMRLLIGRGKPLCDAVLLPEAPAYPADSKEDALPVCTLRLPDDTVLRGQSDYQLSILPDSSRQTVLISANGTGDYTGRVSTVQQTAKRILADESADLPAQKNDSVLTYFCYIPEETGSCTMLTACAEQPFCEMTASGIYDEACEKSADTVLRLYDSSGTLLAENDNRDSTQFSSIETPELQKGRVYYIALSDRQIYSGADAYSFRIAAHKKLLRNMRADYESEYTYHGLPLRPAVRFYDGETLLTEGTDYRICLTDNNAPGTMHLIAEGTGDYCGFRLLSFRVQTDGLDDYDMQPRREISPDVPFAHDAKQYYFVIENGSRLTLRSLSGRQLTGRISKFNTRGLYYEISDSNTVELDIGCYVMTILPDAQEAPEDQDVCMLRTESYSVYMADVTPECVFATGSPVTPHARVYVNGTKLRENTDYTITAEEALTEPGRYRLTLTGIGKYYDSCTFTFRILPADPAELPLLTDGSCTVSLTEPGTAQICRWIPEQTDYCISRTDNRPGSIQVYDSSGGLVASLFGTGMLETHAAVIPGEEYRIAAALDSPELTGDFTFTLTPDYIPLDRCTVRMPAYTAETGVPAYAVYDGDTLLSEGTDYTVLAVGGESQPGPAIILFRGAGKYCGFLSYEYRICPETISDLPKDTVDSGMLPCGQTVTLIRNHPGTMRLLHFIAPASGTYRFTLPDPDYCGVCAFLYDADGNLIPPEQTEAELKAGAALSVLCITQTLATGLENNYYFRIRADAVHPDNEWESDGIRYRLTGTGTALVIDAEHDDEGGIRIPDTVICPGTGETVSVCGIAAALRAEIGETHTIYGSPGGSIAESCRTHALCFAAETPDGTVQGDLTGDGKTDRDDLLTLNRLIAECTGMYLNDTVMQCADLNADGILDMTDLHRMQNLLTQTEA